MYPASDWSGSSLRATMDISARSISLRDRPRLGQTGHQVSIAPGRPVSISSLPLADLGGKIVECIAPTSSAAPHLVSSLVRADARSFVPACTLDMRRAQARSRPAHQCRPQDLALTVPSTAQCSSRLGCSKCLFPRRFEASSLGKYRPGDAGELVGERDRQNVVVQSLLCGLDPGFDPLRQHQDCGGAHSRRRQAPAHARVRGAAIALPIPGSLRPACKGQRQGQGGRTCRLRAAQLHGADPGVRDL